MKWFVDNDVVLKLCILDLVDEAAAAFGVAVSDMHVLSTLKFRVRKHAKEWAKKYDPAFAAATKGRVERFLSVAEVIDEAFDQDLVDSIAPVPKMDSGEAILFASALARTPTPCIVTGDKNCLRALSDERCKPISRALRGQLLCLEQVFERMVEHHGLATIGAKVYAGPRDRGDQTLLVVFGTTPNVTETEVLQRLRTYIDEADGQCGGLLMSGKAPPQTPQKPPRMPSSRAT